MCACPKKLGHTSDHRNRAEPMNVIPVMLSKAAPVPLGGQATFQKTVGRILNSLKAQGVLRELLPTVSRPGNASGCGPMRCVSRGRPPSPAGGIPAQGGGVVAREQPQRHIQSDTTKGAPRHSSTVLGRGSVVALLLRRILRRRAYWHRRHYIHLQRAGECVYQARVASLPLCNTGATVKRRILCGLS